MKYKAYIGSDLVAEVTVRFHDDLNRTVAKMIIANLITEALKERNGVGVVVVNEEP